MTSTDPKALLSVSTMVVSWGSSPLTSSATPLPGVSADPASDAGFASREVATSMEERTPKGDSTDRDAHAGEGFGDGFEDSGIIDGRPEAPSDDAGAGTDDVGVEPLGAAGRSSQGGTSS